MKTSAFARGQAQCFVLITNHSIDINDTHTLPADPVWMSTIDRAQPGTV